MDPSSPIATAANNGVGNVDEEAPGEDEDDTEVVDWLTPMRHGQHS